MRSTFLHFLFQLAALVVLGVSIWILVDQPSFLKVLNVTDDVVGGFDVSNSSYFHTNVIIFSLFSVNIDVKITSSL